MFKQKHTNTVHNCTQLDKTLQNFTQLYKKLYNTFPQHYKTLENFKQSFKLYNTEQIYTKPYTTFCCQKLYTTRQNFTKDYKTCTKFDTPFLQKKLSPREFEPEPKPVPSPEIKMVSIFRPQAALRGKIFNPYLFLLSKTFSRTKL